MATDSRGQKSKAVKFGPLTGTKVVEMGTWVAVPAAAVILGDWGAEVIKVEDIRGGDALRGFRNMEGFDVGEPHTWWNISDRNKRGIVLNFQTEEGRQILLKLMEAADVFMINRHPDRLKKWGLDWESVKKVNPKLIYLTFTGLGEEGPDKMKAGFDITSFWTRSGLMYKAQGVSESPPFQPASMGDNITSMMIAGAVCAALLAREKTGEGQRVSLSLYHTGVWALNWEIQAYLSRKTEVPIQNRRKIRNPIWNTYKGKDGRWFMLAALQSDRFWPDLCRVIGREDLRDDPRFSSAEKRTENNQVLVPILDEVFSTKTVDEWNKMLTENGIVCEKVQSFADVANDPQAIANDFFTEFPHPSGKPFKTVTSPAHFWGTPASIKCPAPEFSQHTEEILQELNYTWEDIARFKEKGVIP